MNISVLTAGLIFLLTFHSSTQQRRKVRNERQNGGLMSGLQGGTLAGFRDQDNMGIQNESQNQGLISGLQRGVLAGLRDLDNMGVKLCKQDFNGTIRQIVAMEAIKNMPLFKQVKESDMRKIMNDSVRSRKVFKAARALIADDEEIAPRVVGATIMGAAQLAADFVKMMLTRY